MLRKFILLLVMIPPIAVLAHDAYIFSENPDKGFRLSDVGALWDKYHKESHDQWKIKVQELGHTLEELNPIKDDFMQGGAPQQSKEDIDPNVDYMEGFTQESTETGEKMIVTHEKTLIEKQASTLQKIIGFLLEQTAVFVFASFAAFVFILDILLRKFFGEKSSDEKLAKYKKMRHQKKMRQKKMKG